MSRITYQRLNLVNREAVEQAGRFDVVFMRNVLIYFRPEQQKRVVDSVAAAIAPDGYLFLGPTESLLHLEIGLAPRDLGGSFCYRPVENSRVQTSPAAETDRSPPTGAESCLGDAATLPQSVGDEEDEESTFGPRLEIALNGLRAGQHQRVLATVNGLKRDFPEKPVVHVIEALTHHRAGDLEKAVLSYRATLYLVPEAGAVRLLLAETLEGLGRKQRANKEYRSALSTVRDTPDEILEALARADLPGPEEMIRECRDCIERTAERRPPNQ
jgi:tetratricopeptide (TPR) repeat protein